MRKTFRTLEMKDNLPDVFSRQKSGYIWQLRCRERLCGRSNLTDEHEVRVDRVRGRELGFLIVAACELWRGFFVKAAMKAYDMAPVLRLCGVSVVTKERRA